MMVSIICGNRYHSKYSRQSDVSDWVTRRSSCTFPTAFIADMMPWIYPFGRSKGYLYYYGVSRVALISHLGPTYFPRSETYSAIGYIAIS
eukprot:4701242-Pleurochrysis_carterae.AAC.1